MNIPSYSSIEFPIRQSEKLQLNQHFPAGEINALYVDAQTLGNLAVYFDAQEDARVLAVAEEHLLPNRVELVGNRLEIESNNFKNFLKKGQAEQIRIEVHVPASTGLDIHFGAGVLILVGGSGAVNIVGGVGEISGFSHSHDINVKLRAGNLNLFNIQGKAALNMNIGSISLDWSELSGDENVEAKCDFGSIDLQLPPAVAVVEEQGGLFLRKTVDVPFSTYINAQVGFGGLETVPAHEKAKRVTA